MKTSATRCATRCAQQFPQHPSDVLRSPRCPIYASPAHGKAHCVAPPKGGELYALGGSDLGPPRSFGYVQHIAPVPSASGTGLRASPQLISSGTTCTAFVPGQRTSLPASPLPPVGPLLAPALSLCGGAGAGAALSSAQGAYLPTATNTPLDGGSNGPEPDSVRQGRRCPQRRTRNNLPVTRLLAAQVIEISPAPSPMRDGAPKIATAFRPRNRAQPRLLARSFGVGGVSEK